MWFGVDFPVAPPSYIKLVKNVYRQRLYFYLVKFQTCCIAGYRDIAPGSGLSEHPSYILFIHL